MILTILLSAAQPMPICPPPPARRVTCIHDGDTFHLNGDKIRIADLDTPEINGKCPYERALAIRARDRLQQLLNAGPYTLVRAGRDKDRNGRMLRLVLRRGESIGQQMVREGFARPWEGTRRPWC